MPKAYVTILEGDIVRCKKTREKFIAKRIDMKKDRMFIRPISGSSKSKGIRSKWVGFKGYQSQTEKITFFRGRHNSYYQWFDIERGINLKQLASKYNEDLKYGDLSR